MFSEFYEKILEWIFNPTAHKMRQMESLTPLSIYQASQKTNALFVQNGLVGIDSTWQKLELVRNITEFYTLDSPSREAIESRTELLDYLAASDKEYESTSELSAETMKILTEKTVRFMTRFDVDLETIAAVRRELLQN